MTPPFEGEITLRARNTTETASEASLLALPAELIQHILAFLAPPELVKVGQTCRYLSVQSFDDQIWHPIVNSYLPFPISNPGPARSFRDLFVTHYPNWFLPKCRIWFGDTVPSGKLLLARYDEGRGCIEAYTVVATRGSSTLSFWEKDPEVIIHSFEPKVSLDLNRPVIKLDLDSRKAEDSPDDNPSDRGYAPKSHYSREILMDTFAESGLYSSYMLCRTLPENAISEGTFVWPPQRVPAASRTRNDSSGGFSATGHRPTRYEEISLNNFRLRKWVEYTGRRSTPSLMSFHSDSTISAVLGIGMPYFASRVSSPGGMSMRMPEDITTYSTLPESCYTPTAQKPWQGIWVGDYSGHGCEFLLITQPDEQHAKPLPSGLDWLQEWFRSGRRGSNSSDGSFTSAVEEQESSSTPGNVPTAGHSKTSHPASSSSSKHPDDHDDVPTGRLEAIKLTGDPNIPRGEYTFIAPDLGHGGFVRVADERAFRGARVVRSAGHIAGRNFREDQYTPSQLLLLSHARLAQFWERFGHISYYQRVDLDALTRYQKEVRV